MKAFLITVFVLGIVGYIVYQVLTGMNATGFTDKMNQNSRAAQDVDK